ncbi:hypothetical protein EDB80DRAFT_824609 [Ilyonectria destructans]|nr:hypothetical protein EDB80DRAFT_824609 [Ilyonectria destructans]
MPPLSKVKWPNPEESCGSEVQTTRLGRKMRAWWARGPAIEKFNQEIDPEITAILKNIDIQDAEINIRVYMIGKREETSRPTVMVCCVDEKVRRRAKEALRVSATLQNNPGFALGSIDYPLEQLVPGRSLASDMANGNVNSTITTRPNSDPMHEVFSTSHIPKIGRPLYITHPGTIDAYSCSTGGVVVEVGRRLFQLTVGHISNVPDSIQHVSLSMDSDACSIDGQSESESESDDGLSAFEQNMHRASMSFCEMSDSGWSGDETDSSTSTTHERYRKSTCTVYSDATSHRNRVLDGTPESPPLIQVGKVALHSRDGNNPNLDYALISIDQPVSLSYNEIVINHEDYPLITQIRQLTAIENEERRVISVTSSSGVLKGMLIPGTTFLAKGNQHRPQKLHVVQLDGVVAEGDSGAVVVDEVSGNLYGHIVSGCPGTRIAYIVAATATFEDLSTRTHGTVSVSSPRRALDPLKKSEDTSRQPKAVKEERYREGNAYNSNTPPSDIDRALSPGRGRKTNCVGHCLPQNKVETIPTRLTSPSGQSLLHAWDPRLLACNATFNFPRLFDTCRSLGSDMTPNRFLLSQYNSEAEVEEVEDFAMCSLEELFSQVSWNRQHPTAILHDYVTSGGLPKHSSLSEPLTAYGLYLRLKELWYPGKEAIPNMKSRTGHSNHCGNDDINRRLIFIADLDRWGFTALAATVPGLQSEALSSALAKYLMCRSSLHVSTSNLRFNLEFHIPFFCWPKRTTKARDSRVRSEGNFIRRCVDLSFLNPGSGSSGQGDGTAVLYEAQISCVITGLDNWTWTAYLFVDTYFEEDSTDDVGSYWDEVEDQYSPDPLTRGNHDANLPESMSDPRTYFLTVLQIRFLQVKEAWEDLIKKLQPRICQYITHHQMSILDPQSSNGGATSASDSSVWIAQSLHAIKQLQYSISQTASEFDRFIDGDVNYFTDQDSFGESFTLVKDAWKSIKHTRHELRKLDGLLGQLIEQCEDFRKDIELHLSIRRNQLAVDSRGKYDMTTSILFYLAC